MIKFIALVGRRPGWSRDAWLAHYRDRHGPLVATTAGFVQASTAYRQNEILAASPAELGQDFDGLTELWFEDSAAMARAFSAPDYLQYVRPDELHFANPDTIVAVTGKAEYLGTAGDLGSACWHLVVLRGSADFRPRHEVLPRTVCGATRMVLAEAQQFPDQPYVAVEEFWFHDEDAADVRP